MRCSRNSVFSLRLENNYMAEKCKMPIYLISEYILNLNPKKFCINVLKTF